MEDTGAVAGSGTAESGPAVPSAGIDVKIGGRKIHIGGADLGRITVDLLLKEGGYGEGEINDYDLFVAGQDEPLDRDAPVRITEGIQLRPIRRSNPYGR